MHQSAQHPFKDSCGTQQILTPGQAAPRRLGCFHADLPVPQHLRADSNFRRVQLLRTASETSKRLAWPLFCSAASLSSNVANTNVRLAVQRRFCTCTTTEPGEQGCLSI